MPAGGGDPSSCSPSPIFATITKEFTFEAAHQLPNHSGKCKNLHGHSYTFVVELEGQIKDADGTSEEGMVMDFSKLSAVWKDHLKPLLDHQFLNDVIAGPTTAERIAAWLLASFASYIPEVGAVVVYETATSSARVEK